MLLKLKLIRAKEKNIIKDLDLHKAYITFKDGKFSFIRLIDKDSVYELLKEQFLLNLGYSNL